MTSDDRTVFLAHISEDKMRCQSLQEHLSKTAELAGNFASEFSCKDWGYACGIMHDIGKYSKEFQERIRGSGKAVDHATAGAIEMAKIPAYPIEYCIAGHHAGLPNGGASADDGGNSSLTGRLKKKVPDYNVFREEVKIPTLQPPAMKMLEKGCFSMSFFIRMLYSCLTDADFLDTEAFMKGRKREYEYDSMAELRDRLMKCVAPWLDCEESDSLNARRTHILRTCITRGKEGQGIYQLTVPTGGGKTVASMAFALHHAVTHDLKRVIYVIPYTNIIEQNAKVFKDILGEENVLENHSNVEYMSEEELNVKQLASENWDMPVVVTTNVQFFESLFASKSSKCRKLHNIANSILVFDEAQMLPNKYLLPCIYGISELVLNYGCTAVLCTATQPSLQELFPRKIASEDLWKGEICFEIKEQYEAFRRVMLVNEREMTKQDLAHRLKENRQVLCILNTRAQVQEIYKLLSEEEGVFHLSTYMYPEHRRHKLNEIRERLKAGKTCCVIATSLVEAGVDLDFGTVYRELVGLDSMIQAAGRCNREGKRTTEESKTYIFQFVKEERKRNERLNQPVSIAAQILEEYEDIGSPEAIGEYFQRLHYIQGESLDSKGIVEELSKARLMSIPFRTVASKFRIIEENTKTILITKTPEAKELEGQLRYGERTKKLMRKIGQYSVNVYEQTYFELQGAGLLDIIDEEIAILKDEERYSDDMGLNVDVGSGVGIFFD